jgi:predicted secreted protein
MTAAPTRRTPRAAAARAAATAAATVALAVATAGCESTVPGERPAGLSSPMWRAPASAGSRGADGVQAVDLRGFRIETRVGEAFEVRLPGFPSSEYRWTLADPLPASIRVAGFERSETGPGILAGAPGQEVWRFEGAAVGSGVLGFEYRRAGDPPSTPPAQRAIYRVEVR